MRGIDLEPHRAKCSIPKPEHAPKFDGGPGTWEVSPFSTQPQPVVEPAMDVRPDIEPKVREGGSIGICGVNAVF